MTTHSLPAARHFRPGRLVRLSLAALLFTVGWVAGKIVAATVWTATAVAIGFRDARGSG